MDSKLTSCWDGKLCISKKKRFHLSLITLLTTTFLRTWWKVQFFQVFNNDVPSSRWVGRRHTLLRRFFLEVSMIGTDLRISVPLVDLFRQIPSWTLLIISLMAAGGVSLLPNLVSHVTAVHCVNEHLFFSLLLRGLRNNGVLEDSFFAFYGSEAFPLLLTLRFGSVFFLASIPKPFLRDVCFR